MNFYILKNKYKNLKEDKNKLENNNKDILNKNKYYTEQLNKKYDIIKEKENEIINKNKELK